MIQDKLQDKIETVTADALESQLLNTNEAIDPVADATIAQPEMVPDPFEPTPDVDAVEVAGLGGIARKALDELKDKTIQAEKRVTMEADAPPPVRQVGQNLVITPADPDEVLKINQQLGGEYTKGLNFPDIFASTGDFDAATFMAQFKDANQELFENARRGTIPFDKMLEMAQERGLDQIVYDLTKRQPGDTLPPEDFLAGMLAYSELMKQSRGAWDAAFKMPAGPERDAALQRALAMSTVHSQVAVNLSGTTSEAARTLQLAGELKRRGIPDVQQELTLFGAKNAQDIEYVGRYYMAITNPSQLARFIQKGANAKTLDQISEIWINSILTSPVTHAINIAGNTTYGMLNNVETFVAAGIGKLRSTVTGNQDRVRAAEALAQLEGMRHAISDAFYVAAKVAVTETPTDLASKLDVRTRRAIGTTGDPREIINLARQGEFGAASVNAFGTFARLGGRALLVEDEFFKAIAGRSELYRQAEIRAGEMYRQTIETGGTVEQARKNAAQERFNVINNPSEDMKKTVQEAARDMTFQGDLDGFLGDLQGAVNHPIAKLFVPFYKTPVNIMKATLERSPAAVMLPSFRKKIMAGGREADIAMSKLAMGSAIMASFAYASYGLDGEDRSMIIVGNGPSDKDARAAMRRQGFQPYSINIKQDDGSYKSITYSRFDPISGMLAMAADFAYYAQYETNQQTLDEVAMAMSVGLAEYLIDMPLLQGVSEVQAAMMNPNAADKFDALLGLLGEKATTAVMSVAPGTGSFTAGLERMADPTARSTMLPSEGFFGEDPTQLPAFARGFYTALQKAKSRNPFFSEDLPPALNEWGEELKVGTGAFWEFWSPIRIQDARFQPVDEELMNLGDGIPRTPKKIDGVLLNNEQYNKWIKMTNELDMYGRLPGHPDYDVSTTLLLSLEQLITDPMYQEVSTKAEKAELIKNVVSQRRSLARKILIEGDPGLGFKIDSVQ